MGNGWGRVWVRFGAMAAMVVVLAFLAKDKADEAKRRNVFGVTLRVEGWCNDAQLGRQYQLVYAGTNRPPLDPQDFGDFYAALGYRVIAEEIPNGMSVLLAGQPERVIMAIYVSRERAKVIVLGNPQQAEMERMNEPILNLAWSAGVKAKGVGTVTRQADQPQHWHFTFEYAD